MPASRHPAQPASAESPSVAFLRWALPRLGLSWTGFRRVRRQVWRRIGRRVQELHLGDPAAYRAYLQRHPEEWQVLESLCHVTISRFFRDRAVFERLAADVLPTLASEATVRREKVVRAWSAGCASGEEPYSVRLLWHFRVAARFPGVSLQILATDIDDAVLERATAGWYRKSSLRELPTEWIAAAFIRQRDVYGLRALHRSSVTFRRGDIRTEVPPGLFDLVLCRNLVFTYFDDVQQRHTLYRLLSCLREGGALVIGRRETLPSGAEALEPWAGELGIFRRLATTPVTAVAMETGSWT